MYFFSFNQSWNKALFFALPSLNNINLWIFNHIRVQKTNRLLESTYFKNSHSRLTTFCNRSQYCHKEILVAGLNEPLKPFGKTMFLSKCCWFSFACFKPKPANRGFRRVFFLLGSLVQYLIFSNVFFMGADVMSMVSVANINIML